MAGFDFSVKFIRQGGYSFDEETILALVRQLNSFLKTDAADVDVTLKDGQTIVSKNVQELFEDTYVTSNLIVQLVIRAFTTEAPLRKVWVSCLTGRRIRSETERELTG